MKLLLVRHGESIWNKEFRIQGNKDPGLSELGIRQARRVGLRLKNEGIGLIFSSSLKRCVQTAEIIAKKTGSRVRICDGIEEIMLGQWQGKTVEEVKRAYPEEYKQWLKAPSKARIPGWEGISKFNKRINRAFNSILADNTVASVCVITHWGVLSAYFSKTLKTDFDKFFKTVKIDNCGISKVSCDNGITRIHYINDTRHLGRDLA